MSLHPQVFRAVPAETVRVARAAYPKGNVYLQVRDELGTIYTDQSFAELFPKCGQPTEAAEASGVTVWATDGFELMLMGQEVVSGKSRT